MIQSNEMKLKLLEELSKVNIQQQITYRPCFYYSILMLERFLKRNCCLQPYLSKIFKCQYCTLNKKRKNLDFQMHNSLFKLTQLSKTFIFPIKLLSLMSMATFVNSTNASVHNTYFSQKVKMYHTYLILSNHRSQLGLHQLALSFECQALLIVI